MVHFLTYLGNLFCNLLQMLAAEGWSTPERAASLLCWDELQIQWPYDAVLLKGTTLSRVQGTKLRVRAVRGGRGRRGERDSGSRPG